MASIPSRRGKSSLLDLITNNEKLVAYLFILPSLIGFVIFYAIPAIRAVQISFLEWNLLSDPKFVGFENYQKLIEDERFWASMSNTIAYVLWNIPLETALAVLMAVVLERFSSGVSNLLRSIMILPWLLPNVIVALLWLWMLDPQLGIVNQILGVFGIDRQPFLGSPDQAIPMVAMINIWRHVGYKAILIYAGLKVIPRSLYEAASIDGASEWTKFTRITLPLLRPVLAFVLVTSVIGSFQIYDTIAITTDGGPAGATRVIIYYIFEQVFARRINMGMATAASVFLFAVLVAVTIIQNRLLRSGQSDLADYS